MNGEIMSNIYLLYKALRYKRPNFREYNYIWKLGCNTMQKLVREVHTQTEEISINGLDDYGYLYGIKVERDEDPDGLRILEDITPKL